MIAGRYIEVDPPNRMAIQRDRQGTDKATPARALIEITFTLKGYSTTVVEVRLSGPSPDDAAFCAQLLARYLDRLAAAFAGTEPAALPHNRVRDSASSPIFGSPGQLHATRQPRSGTEPRLLVSY